MQYYIIHNENVMIANNPNALADYGLPIKELPDDYEFGKYIVVDNELVLNPNWEEEQAQKERERIAQLHLTRGDVFRGLLMARQVTRAQIRALIEQMPDETPEQQIAKEYALIDFDESLDFYRGVALIETLGHELGISSEAMTQFFETNDWHYLVPDTRGGNND